MTIVRVSIVCLIDRWIWISVSSVLHFVCCTFFFPLPPPLLAFSSAHYLPNLLPHMQTMCNESLSYLFSTNNSNSDMISIHILEATHDYNENQYLERLSCLRVPHFEDITLISWTKEEESLSWQEICHSGWFLVRNINFVVSVLKLLVCNGNFSDDWASSCKTKPIIALKLLVHCFIQQCAIWYKANVISSWFFPNSENDSLMTAKLRCVWVPKSFKV